MGTGAYENASPAAAVVDTAPTPTPAGELTATALLQKVRTCR